MAACCAPECPTETGVWPVEAPEGVQCVDYGDVLVRGQSYVLRPLVDRPEEWWPVCLGCAAFEAAEEA